ncbi:helix-turn-helix transcriptional regulator [Amphibacillus indicireducens]|uniref:HTH cro/C1-type domain-containing protein n=1 Tax=Amphibacillus indicireducens TaxID=1076330 RepID=A0ABP7V1J5_9BACI
MSIIFRENIGKVMNEKRISQVYLESTSGISRQTISKLVQTFHYSNYDIRLSTALSIALALDVDFSSLFFRLNNTEIKQLNSFVIKDYLEIFRKRKNTKISIF